MGGERTYPQGFPQTAFTSWSVAMRRALYGPDGFYRGESVPVRHFRTSVHASPLFAEAVARLARSVDLLLAGPDEFTLVDLGAGDGALLTGVAAALRGDPLAGRLRLVAVDLARRPAGLDAAVGWAEQPPRGFTGLLIANEWLDNVPCDVAEYRDGRWRAVEVAANGVERLGPPPSGPQAAWLERWWPSPDEGGRAEVGLSRDEAWRDAVAALARGVAVAVDYAHTRTDRPPAGTLTGYAHGRQVPPVPDGSRDVTAHVALDSCAAAASADWTVLSTQRDVLRGLGVSGARPPLALAGSDPAGYIRALSRAAEAAELTDPAGLGGFGWLIQGAGIGRPPELAGPA